MNENKNLCKGTARYVAVWPDQRVKGNQFQRKNSTRNGCLDRNFQTIWHNGKHSKYAFAIYLNTQYLGPNTWAGLARFAVLPISRHLKFNFQTRSQGWQGCSTLWLHDHRDSSATSLPADVLWGLFVTHSFLKWMRDKRTPKDVCGEATRQLDKGTEPGSCNQALALIN